MLFLFGERVGRGGGGEWEGVLAHLWRVGKLTAVLALHRPTKIGLKGFKPSLPRTGWQRRGTVNESPACGLGEGGFRL